MALNIKDPVVDRLAKEIAELTGETKTGAIRRALQERRQRLALHQGVRDRRAEVLAFLESEVWPLVPAKVLGKRLTRREEARILGYGAEGV